MIKEIKISNFLSFKEETLYIATTSTVLVGINGSGKSNIFKVLKLLQEGVSGIGLKSFIIDILGGIDNIRYKSAETVDKPVELQFRLDWNTLKNYGFSFTNDVIYEIKLLKKPDVSNFSVEEQLVSENGYVYLQFNRGSGHLNELKKNETEIRKTKTGLVRYNDFVEPTELALSKIYDTDRYYALSTIRKAIADMVVYDYFDTTPQSAIRKPMLPTSGKRLSANGSNLPQILNTIKINYKQSYQEIVSKLNEINPNFSGFDFNFIGGNIELMLEEKNLSSSIHVSSISDGTLRYLCLLAVLSNPDRGCLVCIDEPETGLHPDMISGIGRLINEVSTKSNIIISTHSSCLLNSFEVENIRVIEKGEDNTSKILKYTTKDFDGWYEEFSPGNMWRNGDLGGNRW